MSCGALVTQVTRTFIDFSMIFQYLFNIFNSFHEDSLKVDEEPETLSAPDAHCRAGLSSLLSNAGAQDLARGALQDKEQRSRLI